MPGEPARTSWEGWSGGSLQGRETRAGGAQSERHHQEEQRQTWQAAATATGKYQPSRVSSLLFNTNIFFPLSSHEIRTESRVEIFFVVLE